MPTTQPKKLTKEQEQMWTILADNYADQAYEMLDDMCKNGKVNYRKADKYFKYIMDNWPIEKTLDTTKTWLSTCSFDTRKLKTYDRFVELYAEYIEAHAGEFKILARPTYFDIY